MIEADLSQADQNSAAPKLIAGDMAVLARRYAGALYELAAERKQLDAVASDLRSLNHLIQDSAEFRAIANHPRLDRAQLVKAVQQVTASAKFNALTGNFLALTAQNRRLPLLGPICDAFLTRLAAERGEFSAEVRAAHALTPAQQEQLATQLQTLAGGKVHMTVAEDETLLGGLTVKMGSQLIDASIKSKLAKLERQLKTQSSTVWEGAA